MTVKTHMDTNRVWIRNVEIYRAAPESLSEFVHSPALTGSEGQRSDHLPVERGDRILENVRKYMWGSMEHVVYELWWAAAIRLGGVHSLDVTTSIPRRIMNRGKTVRSPPSGSNRWPTCHCSLSFAGQVGAAGILHDP